MSLYYVSEGSAAIARSIEKKIQSLSPDVGILFVSCSPDPEEDGISTLFFIYVGAKRKEGIDSNTIDTLILHVVRQEYPVGTIELFVKSFFGVQGMCIK